MKNAEIKNGATTPEIKTTRGDKLTLALFCITLCLVVGTASFFAGYVVRERKMNEELRTLDWVITQIKKNYYEDFTANEIIDAATTGLETLLDRHSKYYNEQEYRAAQHGDQGYKLGIGIGIGVAADGKGIATRVVMGSPAEDAGIVKGDVLLGVREIKNPEVPFTLGETALEFSAALEQVPENVEFELLISRDGEQSIRKVIKKEYMQITTRYYTQAEIPFLPAHAAYLRFDTFMGNAVKEFGAAMDRFKQEGKTALILDLRGNGGGKVGITQKIAAHLLKAERGTKPLMMVARYQNHEEKVYTAPSVYSDYNFTAIRVLCDENSASASEVLMGAMLDHGSISLQDVYGTCTYGKGIMQTTFDRLGAEDAIKLTTAKLYWPITDTCIQGVGITPGTIAPLALNGNSYSFLRDATLAAAVASLNP